MAGSGASLTIYSVPSGFYAKITGFAVKADAGSFSLEVLINGVIQPGSSVNYTIPSGGNIVARSVGGTVVVGYYLGIELYKNP